MEELTTETNIPVSLEELSEALELVQTLDPGRNTVLARFEEGSPAIVLVKRGRGRLYYLASPLVTADYHKLLVPLADRLGLNRPVLGLDSSGVPVTGAEVRAVERRNDYLVYACNLGEPPVEFDLEGEGPLGWIEDLRRLEPLTGTHVRLGPYQEMILRVEKVGKR